MNALSKIIKDDLETLSKMCEDAKIVHVIKKLEKETIDKVSKK